MNDIVRREDVIECLECCDYITDRNFCNGETLLFEDELRKMLMDLPPISWVLCRDKMPDVEAKYADCEGFNEKDGEYVPVNVYTCYESDPVLVSTEYGIFVAVYCVWITENGEREQEWRDTFEGDFEEKLKEVEAWMPIPVNPFAKVQKKVQL